MVKLILTGATSFIGSKFLENILLHTDWEVYSFERLPSPPYRLGSLTHSTRIHRLYHDLRAEIPQRMIDLVADAKYLVHFAADVSGVKSLTDPVLSVKTNVLGTYNVLELVRKVGPWLKFIYISTGEAVGRAEFPKFLPEDVQLRPSNPYAASKAAGEVLVNAYHKSFNVPMNIVRVMNVFGPKQQLTRFVPMTIKNLIDGKIIKCHVDKHGQQGSRNWLHVDKVCETLEYLLDHGQSGETYHVVGPERTNIDIIRALSRFLNLNFHVESVVPGPSHDLRYALKDTKLKLDFSSDFESTLESTAKWYDNYRGWLL